MKALTQAARAICLVTAKETDVARRAKNPAERAAAAARVALLTPIAKAFSTDIGCEVASIGVQVHGGMGFIEETGAAQIYRDARILPIYEGTNGIQAIDLVTRKLPLEGGKVVEGYIGELKQTVDDGARLQPAGVRPHGRAARRGGGCAGRGDAAGWAEHCAPTPMRRWPARHPICGCSAWPPEASISRKGALAAARNGASDGARTTDRRRAILRREPRHRGAKPQGDRHRRRGRHAGTRA